MVPAIPMSSASPVQVLEEPSRVEKALAPLRRLILEELAEPDSATGLASRLGMPRQKVNYHLRELEKAGLVELLEERQRRGCVERVFRPTATAFVIDPALLGPLGSLRDRFSSAYLLSLAARLVRDVAVLRERASRAAKKLLTQSMETEIRFESPGDFEAFSEELMREIERLTKKYGARKGARARRFRLILGAHPAVASVKETR